MSYKGTKKIVTAEFVRVIYYIPAPFKDLELPYSHIWFATIDIDRGLDFS